MPSGHIERLKLPRRQRRHFARLCVDDLVIGTGLAGLAEIDHARRAERESFLTGFIERDHLRNLRPALRV